MKGYFFSLYQHGTLQNKIDSLSKRIISVVSLLYEEVSPIFKEQIYSHRNDLFDLHIILRQQ